MSFKLISLTSLLRYRGTFYWMIVLFVSISASASDNEVTFLLSVNKPPYAVYDEITQQISGIDHEIIQTVSADIDMPIQFSLMPAPRVQVEAKSDKWSGRWIFTSTVHSEKALPDYLPTNYRMTESVYKFNCVRVLDRGSAFVNAPSFNGARIVKTLGHTKETVAKITGITQFDLIDVVNDENAIRMLSIDRVDLAFMESFVFFETIKKLGISLDTFDVKPCNFWPSDDSIIYLLGPGINDERFHQFNNSLKKLKQNGVIDKIIKRYLPDMPNEYY